MADGSGAVVAEQATDLFAEVDHLRVEGAGEIALGDHPLARAATQLGLTSTQGMIAFVGQNANGQYQVQYNQTGGSGYSSTWPQWAYEVAKTALTTGKRIWVGANGDPFGPNLVFVLVMAS